MDPPAAPFNDVAHVHPALIAALAAVRRQQPAFRRDALYAERDGLVMPESCIQSFPKQGAEKVIASALSLREAGGDVP